MDVAPFQLTNSEQIRLDNLISQKQNYQYLTEPLRNFNELPLINNKLQDDIQAAGSPWYLYKGEFRITDNRIIGIKPKENRVSPDDLVDGDFIITVDGDLKIGRGHDLLSGNAPFVRAAGELQLNANGKIISITNQSGHYKPTNQDRENIESFLRNLGLWE